MKHVPNTLSIIRIFAACAVLVTMLTVPPENKTLFLLVPGLLFVLASITDLIDGYIARKYELITDFGKFIDPIADKLLTVFAMLGFLQIDADEGKLFMFIAIAVTLLREFVVSSLRMYAASHRLKAPPENAGLQCGRRPSGLRRIIRTARRTGIFAMRVKNRSGTAAPAASVAPRALRFFYCF